MPDEGELQRLVDQQAENTVHRVIAEYCDRVGLVRDDGRVDLSVLATLVAKHKRRMRLYDQFVRAALPIALGLAVAWVATNSDRGWAWLAAVLGLGGK